MTHHLEDIDLVENIQKQKKVEDSLNELVVRHSGIYLEMINSYAGRRSQFIDYEDLVQEKEYAIYSAAMKFDKNRGAKFSTYLGNETKWMCLNLYNRNKRRPAFHTEFLENIPETPSPDNPIHNSIKDDIFSKVLSMIKNNPDTRVEKIFNMRYIIGSKNKVMPWKKIGKELNLSIQGCINIHNSAIKQVKQELSKEI